MSGERKLTVTRGQLAWRWGFSAAVLAAAFWGVWAFFGEVPVQKVLCLINIPWYKVGFPIPFGLEISRVFDILGLSLFAALASSFYRNEGVDEKEAAGMLFGVGIFFVAGLLIPISIVVPITLSIVVIMFAPIVSAGAEEVLDILIPFTIGGLIGVGFAIGVTHGFIIGVSALFFYVTVVGFASGMGILILSGIASIGRVIRRRKVLAKLGRWILGYANQPAGSQD